MFGRFQEWLRLKWTPSDPAIQTALAQDYHATFSTAQGRRVLKHLLDNVYCTLFEGGDPILMAYSNGRRSVVHEILENIDQGENPRKYETPVDTEVIHGR